MSTHEAVGHPVAELAAADHRASPAAFADDLLDLARRSRTTRIELGAVDPDDVGIAEALTSLAEQRRAQIYGLQLSCRVSPAIAAGRAPLLRAAGIKRVVVDPTLDSVDGSEEALLRTVAIVGGLQREGIAVSWRVVVGPREEATAIARLCAALHHITPPAGLWPVGAHADELVDAVEEWQHSHTPNSLTYGRGPGFVRIYDRRTPAETVTFVTLDGAQADAFLAARRPSSPAELSRFADGASEASVQRFLDQLVARGVVCVTTTGLYQSVPLRRRMEERWVEGDL